MLTKKTFELIASQLRAIENKARRNRLVASAILVCKKSNPQFNEARFRAACKP